VQDLEQVRLLVRLRQWWAEGLVVPPLAIVGGSRNEKAGWTLVL